MEIVAGTNNKILTIEGTYLTNPLIGLIYLVKTISVWNFDRTKYVFIQLIVLLYVTSNF